MPDHPNTPQIDQTTANRRIFSETHLIMGMPSGIALMGFVITAASYFISKSFIAPFIFAIPYFSVMTSIHREDERAFQIWLSIWRDKTSHWEAGNRRPIELIFLAED